MSEKLDELDDKIDFDRIVKRGDDIRKRILETTEVDTSKIARNAFGYRIDNDNIGLNEISNVDMGYACTSIGLDGSHLSKRNPYLLELEHNVRLMEESKNSMVILNGELFTFIPRSRSGELLSYNDQIAYFYSLFKNLAKQNKIMAIVRGKEEHRILKNQRIDVLDVLQEALGLKGKVCNDAFINVTLTDDLVGDADVGIRTINWNNTATTAAYLGRKMEDRAVRKGGADIYLGRSTMNFFKVVDTGESKDGTSQKHPIYLISPGPYTRFKGATMAGAEYNSIKDNELAPNNFWYKVSVVPNPEAQPGQRPYTVKVCPVNYSAHQIVFQGTDEITDNIMNQLGSRSDSYVEYLLSKYPEVIGEHKEKVRRLLRETLLANKPIVDENKRIAEFREYLKTGVIPTHPTSIITDIGAPSTAMSDGLDDDLVMQKG